LSESKKAKQFKNRCLTKIKKEWIGASAGTGFKKSEVGSRRSEVGGRKSEMKKEVRGMR
jgi:hypothetical protein